MQQLSPMEMQIAKLIAEGMTFDEMGAELGISPRTAKAHSDRIRLKLGISKKRQIPKVLRDLGLLK